MICKANKAEQPAVTENTLQIQHKRHQQDALKLSSTADNAIVNKQDKAENKTVLNDGKLNKVDDSLLTKAGNASALP